MNLATIIEDHPADAVAFRYRGESITYGELRERCATVRRALVARGIAPGDRVALCFPTTPEFAVAYLGALGVGAVTVPLNPSSPTAELHRELAAVRTSLVLSPTEPTEGLTATAGELARLGYEVTPLGALEAEGRAVAEPAPIVDRSPEQEAALLFTSGTAGSPKAAVLTHGNMRANIDQVELRVGLAVTSDDVGILAVPPFHILGLNAVLGVQLYAGGSLVLLERFDPATMLEAIKSEKVTVLAGVPQLFDALARYEGAAGDELASVRLACSGAAPLSEATAAAFEARYGVPIWQGYGLTEASPTVTFPDLAGRRKVSSVGMPLPGVEVRVVDADGHDVEHGDPGEVLVRGPNVFAGYFEDPDATDAALDRHGWLHTGDIAVMADDGSLSIVDRHKDLIIVSGFNVYPAEVEQALCANGCVADAAVVGVPDPAQGESVRAFVVPTAEAWPADAAEPTGIDEATLVAHCARHLARYKCPASISFVRELPRGMQGKVLRRAVG